MEKLVQQVKNFWNDEAGATAVEYGLMVALIAGAILIGATAVGVNLNTLFTNVAALLVLP